MMNSRRLSSAWRVALPFLLLLLLLAGCPDRTRPGGDDDDAAGDDDSAGDNDDDDATTDDDDDVGDDDDNGDDDATSDDDDTVGACEGALGGRLSNIGCEFWAVDLDNAENSFDNAAGAQFAVAVANVSATEVAHVEVEINTAEQGLSPAISLVEAADINPGDVYLFRLPRRDVDGENVTINVDDGSQTWLSSRAFRLNSDVPVVAYQFNTVDQQFSNDASMLLPTNGLGLAHLVLGYAPSGPIAEIINPMSGEVVGQGPANRSYVTIVGTEAATTVDVTPTYDIQAGVGVSDLGGGVGIAAGSTRSFTIGTYDVLNLETMFMEQPTFDLTDLTAFLEWLNSGASDLSGEAPDLTGTVVTSNKRVAVFTGVDLAMVTGGCSDGYDNDGDGAVDAADPGCDDDNDEFDDPATDTCCAEHIEQQVLPTQAMRRDYVVSHSAQRSSGEMEPDLVRILAANDGTTITTNLSGADSSFTLNAGEFREIWARSSFIVEATGPVHVGQFLVVGLDINSPIAGAGDSSLLYIPPISQRREDYVFTTGEGFQSNWVVVSVPQGVAASLDGSELSTLSACSGPVAEGTLGTTSYEAWTCEISDGVHRIYSGSGSEPGTDNIGVLVYGYYAAGSYSYPAGAGLE